MTLQPRTYRQPLRRVIWGLSSSLLWLASTYAQSTPSFEVATVKVHTNGSGPRIQSGGRFTAYNQTLQDLILYAYDRSYYDLEVPTQYSWIAQRDTTFDINAQGPPRATNADLRKMLQSLLADRFSLKLREENREMPAYAMVVGRSDHKLGKGLIEVTGKPCDADARPPDPNLSNQPRCGGRVLPTLTALGYELRWRAATMQQLSIFLSVGSVNGLGRRVIDKTNLTGDYNISLDYSLRQNPLATPVDNRTDGPELVVALPEQLGLKLESTRVAYPILVVESAAMPGEN